MDSNLYTGGPSNSNNFDMNLIYVPQQPGYQCVPFSQMGYFPGFQNRSYMLKQQSFKSMPEQMHVKLENMFENQAIFPSIKSRAQKKFESNKVKAISKSTQEALDKLLAPPPATDHKVAYFDPNNAPLLTAEKYFVVESEENEKVKMKKGAKQFKEYENELDSEESDSNPFIVFRYRRIKKKYKKYIKNPDDFEILSGEESESLSESGSLQPQEKEEKSQSKCNFLHLPQENQRI